MTKEIVKAEGEVVLKFKAEDGGIRYSQDINCNKAMLIQVIAKMEMSEKRLTDELINSSIPGGAKSDSS